MSETRQWIELERDCEAVMIPAGHTILLPRGTRVAITQSLGGSYTLSVPDYGGLVRVAKENADALGLEPEEAPASGSDAAPIGRDELEARVWEELKSCYDPEIPVNIVDLGLIYDLEVTAGEAGRHRVAVKMTLTAPGCGMGVYIAEDARQKILALPGVEDAAVEIVWTPQWNPNMISPEGRAKLGME